MFPVQWVREFSVKLKRLSAFEEKLVKCLNNEREEDAKIMTRVYSVIKNKNDLIASKDQLLNSYKAGENSKEQSRTIVKQNDQRDYCSIHEKKLKSGSLEWFRMS